MCTKFYGHLQGMHDIAKLQIELTKKEADIQHLEGSIAQAHATSCRSQMNDEEIRHLKAKVSQIEALQHELSCLYEEIQGAIEIAAAALRPSGKNRFDYNILVLLLLLLGMVRWVHRWPVCTCTICADH